MSGFIQSGRFGGAADPIGGITWAFRFESSNITGLADADKIATWPDTSGNSRNATQATDANRPVYKTGILNGEPAVRFSSLTAERLVTSSITAITQPNTVFLVCSFGGRQRVAMDGIGASNRLYVGIRADWDEYEVYAGASAFESDPTPYSTARIHQIMTSGAASKWRVAGGAAATMSVGTDGLGGVTIGNRYANNQSVGGDVFALLVANSNLSLADLDTVGNYLASKYALTWSAAS